MMNVFPFCGGSMVDDEGFCPGQLVPISGAVGNVQQTPAGLMRISTPLAIGAWVCTRCGRRVPAQPEPPRADNDDE